MISEKANAKLHLTLRKLRQDKVETLAVLIAAKNILIEDITRKGDLVIKQIKE